MSNEPRERSEEEEKEGVEVGHSALLSLNMFGPLSADPSLSLATPKNQIPGSHLSRACLEALFH
jgi:hypothetical protein